MGIPERLTKLRAKMEEKGIDVYVVPTADFHQSEYVGEHFKARQFITGFSGSAGTAVITANEGRLWTDGRYFVQAARQLSGSGVELMKMGEPQVPTLEEYLKKTLSSGEVLGFDGRVTAMREGKKYKEIASSKSVKVIYDCDLVNEIWEDRPPLSKEPVFALALEYSGESTADKLTRIRKKMEEYGASWHVLTTLDDICWTLNIRGNDVMYFPLVLSYALISMDKFELFIDESKLSAKIKEDLAKDGVVLRPYNDIYEDIKKIDEGETLLLDPAKVNYALYHNIPSGVRKVEKPNPEIGFKAVKNAVEVANIRKAQIKDSVAHVRFMKWLKENIGKIEMTELSVADKLEEFRIEMGNYIRPSFAPISSFGEHAALPHYSPGPESNSVLEKGNVLLTDTGAGFYEGTTDITRTYALGEISQEIKDHFTLVAISNLRLADAKFLHGATGIVLDMLARKPLWDRNLNFNHGTGHGVGYLLNIHEGPADFRWQYRDGGVYPIEEGMIITDEPGIYIEGSHGIRLENELLACKGEKNEYGQFMYFEAITYIPLDLDAINPKLMTEEDKGLLNAYHKTVFEKVSPYLTEEETQWLAQYTREI